MSTLKKVLLSNAASGLFPECMRAVKTHWELSDDLESSLARAIAADKDDFSSKSKLRLLHIVKALCCGGAYLLMTIMHSALEVVDEVLAEILVAPRATLARLVVLVAKCQNKLWELLSWEAESWRLLCLLHGEDIMIDDQAQRWGRVYSLQLSASMYDHFEDRMEHPPYSVLCTSNSPSLPHDEVDRRVTHLFNEP